MNSTPRLCRLLTLTAAAALSGFAQTHTPLADPILALIPDSPTTIQLTQVANGMVQPVWGTYAPGDKDHLYVVDQVGKIFRVNVSSKGKPSDTTVFLDITKRIVPLGLFGINYDERGFLGIAFHPRFKENGLMYTFTSEPVSGKADFSTLPTGAVPNCQTVILEWHVLNADREDSNHPLMVQTDSLREVMRIDKPQFNHNGGAIVFGTDGFMYIGVGDGGAANDIGMGHVAGGNAQSLASNNVLGKILRIDPTERNSANGKYGIPEGNPFVNKGAPEVWAYGFRNPFRISVDPATGDLWVGDVGQNNIEEVDLVDPGKNYGWPIKEGTFLFDVNAANSGFVYANSPGAPANLIDPIAQYDHADGVPPTVPNSRVAIIGGFVHRGKGSKDLKGNYIFGDYSGPIGTPVNGHIYLLNRDDNTFANLKVDGRAKLGLAVLGFGQDAGGEVYLMASETGVVKGLTGQVFKITSASAPKKSADAETEAGEKDAE